MKFSQYDDVNSASDSDLLLIDQPPFTGNSVKNISKANFLSGISTSLFYNVKDSRFGAIGNGVADDSGAINSAITAASNAGGGVVFIPAGTYKLLSNIVPVDGVNILGVGYGSVLKPNTLKTLLITANNCFISNIRIDTSLQVSGLSPADKAIHVLNATNILFDNIYSNCIAFGVFIDANGHNITSDIRVKNSYLYGQGNNDIIGGGPSSDFATVQNVYVDKNTIIQDNTTNSYPNAVDLVQVKNTSYTNNKTKGSLVFGSELDPHLSSAIQGNNVQPAINATVGNISILAKAGSIVNGHALLVTGNILTIGAIILTGSSSSSTSYWSINDNILYAVPNIGIAVTNAFGGTINDNIIQGSNTAIKLTSVTTSSVGSNTISIASVGILEDVGCSNNSMVTNVFNAVTTPVSNLALSDQVINNIGLNPSKQYNAGNSSTAITVDRINGDDQTISITASTTITMTDGIMKSDKLILNLSNTGSFTATFSGNFKLAGGTYTLTSGSGKIDIISFIWDGTAWKETNRSQNLS